MTLAFSTVFTNLGAIAGGLAETDTFSGTTVPSRVNTLVADLPEAVYDGVQSQQTAAVNATAGWATYLGTLATNYVNAAVYADNPLLSATNLQQNLTELVRQMNANAQTVQSAAVSSSTTPTLTNGNGVLTVSTVDNNGFPVEMCYPEKVRAACTGDSTTGATAGSEQFTLTGQAAVTTGALSAGFPGGSGASTFLNAVSPSAASALLGNGDFETWSGSPATATDWAIVVGTAGTTVVQEATPYTGTYSCGIVGNGSELTSIKQILTGLLSPATQYAFNLFYKVNTVPAAGVFAVDLIDGSNNVLTNKAGNNNQVSLNVHTTATTSWQSFSGTFQTPAILPSSYYLRLHLTTAMSSGSTLYLDRVALAPMKQHYTAGPSYAVFSGSSNFYLGDFFTTTVANAHPNKSFVRFFQRAFNLPALGLRLPTAGSPTLADTLIA